MADAQQTEISQSPKKLGETNAISNSSLSSAAVPAPMDFALAQKVLQEGRSYSNRAGDDSLNQKSQSELDLAVKTVEYQARHKAVDLDQKWILRSQVYNSIQHYKHDEDPDFPALQPTAYKDGIKSFNALKPEEKTEENVKKEISETIKAGQIAKATGMIDAFVNYQSATNKNYNSGAFVAEMFEKICPID